MSNDPILNAKLKLAAMMRAKAEGRPMRPQAVDSGPTRPPAVQTRCFPAGEPLVSGPTPLDDVLNGTILGDFGARHESPEELADRIDAEAEPPVQTHCFPIREPLVPVSEQAYEPFSALADRIDAEVVPAQVEPDLTMSNAYDAIGAVLKVHGQVTFDCWWENMNTMWGKKPE